jgi:hypothetical protein
VLNSVSRESHRRSVEESPTSYMTPKKFTDVGGADLFDLNLPRASPEEAYHSEGSKMKGEVHLNLEVLDAFRSL